MGALPNLTNVAQMDASELRHAADSIAATLSATTTTLSTDASIAALGACPV